MENLFVNFSFFRQYSIRYRLGQECVYYILKECKVQSACQGKAVLGQTIPVSKPNHSISAS